ncbi:hypothetical protein A2973_02035 [Candidatus Gottesmanbacteria bacterium RIFCSPLOWO2_01_FULL_49_10]|uniref:Uncharacterized protein n=1 Tax=Candidatus Gottesmanbacteria bacterium RIFCSPLOWO2_01_FULL_49_10 TaxID=1798396 RepID=A0A1F6AVS9_9BACT|nr:MAG: hypothetical protein A2973_02035 [Candidatus Gottesmanbacteria bacterium RIFCSPLOWO2_01_FULL_49_10]
MSEETLNPSFAGNLRTGAQWLENKSSMPVPLDRSSADYILALIPPFAELIGVWTSETHGLDLKGIAATLLMAVTSVSLFKAGDRHDGTQMQVSEWIGPGLARGMHIAAGIFDTKPSTP